MYFVLYSFICFVSYLVLSLCMSDFFSSLTSYLFLYVGL